MNLSKLFSSGAADKMKLKRSSMNNEWMVQKGSNILYVGSKDKCQTYISHH